MAKAGSDYEKESGEFFASIGLNAEVQKRVEGVRSVHCIDVWVTGKLGAFDVRWVVECKDWNSSIPKEKVLALQTIVQDVGADRGWLLSEKGFQAGAVRYAELTNITLTSLKCLREETMEYLQETQMRRLLSDVENLQMDLQDRISDKRESSDPRKGVWCPPESCYNVLGKLVMLSLALKRGLRKDYPILCDALEEDGKEIPRVAESDHDLIDKVGESLERLKTVVSAATRALDEDEV